MYLPSDGKYTVLGNLVDIVCLEVFVGVPRIVHGPYVAAPVLSRRLLTVLRVSTSERAVPHMEESHLRNVSLVDDETWAT